ncbi:hypothetical protein [Pseudomonas sp. PS01303]|uniref:hypothetical protein n=1 Tax=Pseudomonas sp. PS01303 TaxID=2991439 RepID=UPI00249A9D08|nr:hypothetical protein [Pseudomonas sp. PS01303]
MVFTIANELVNHYSKKLDREVIDEITSNLTLEMCQGPTAWAFSGKDQPGTCLQPQPDVVVAVEFDRVTAERDALQLRLNAADQRIDELERDKHRLDALESNCWDVRFDSSPNGDSGDSSINIEIVGHWMDKPYERVIGENYNENLRAAIDQAMTAPAYPPARPEYPEPESAKDDDWHMNPCKQGHRDVGAAGGVAACNQCDEKIEAASTQEAFERWNATHPVIESAEAR